MPYFLGWKFNFRPAGCVLPAQRHAIIHVQLDFISMVATLYKVPCNCSSNSIVNCVYTVHAGAGQPSFISILVCVNAFDISCSDVSREQRCSLRIARFPTYGIGTSFKDFMTIKTLSYPVPLLLLCEANSTNRRRWWFIFEIGKDSTIIFFHSVWFFFPSESNGCYC